MNNTTATVTTPACIRNCGADAVANGPHTFSLYCQPCRDIVDAEAEGEHKVSRVIYCAYCDHSETIRVTNFQLVSWEGGELAQDVFPELTDDQREMLISKTCGDCFEELYGQESGY